MAALTYFDFLSLFRIAQHRSLTYFGEMSKWPTWFPTFKNETERREQQRKNKVVLFIPSRLADKSMVPPIIRTKMIEAAMNFLLGELGGATHIEGKGYYVGEDGETHVEDVTLCMCYCSDDSLAKHGQELNKIANSLAIECGQESLAVTYNGEMGFFKPTEHYRSVYAGIKQSWNKKTPTEGYSKYLYEALAS